MSPFELEHSSCLEGVDDEPEGYSLSNNPWRAWMTSPKATTHPVLRVCQGEPEGYSQSQQSLCQLSES